MEATPTRSEVESMSKPFQGVINIDVRDAVADWSPYMQPVAPEGAPNVVYIVLDDIGFSAMEPWGGLIETPNINKLAASGLTYTTGTRPRCARRRGRRCAPAATTPPTGWPASPRPPPVSPAPTATSRS